MQDLPKQCSDCGASNVPLNAVRVGFQSLVYVCDDCEGNHSDTAFMLQNRNTSPEQRMAAMRNFSQIHVEHVEQHVDESLDDLYPKPVTATSISIASSKHVVSDSVSKLSWFTKVKNWFWSKLV